jgi:hypothetical protein
MAGVCASVARVRPGATPPRPTPGDLILVRGQSWESSIVRALQRLKAWDEGLSDTAPWSHAALVVSDGRIFEVVRGNAVLRRIENYRSADYDYVHFDLPSIDRRLIVQRAMRRIGRRHGPWRLTALGIAIFTRGQWFRAVGERLNCAAVVAHALAPVGGVLLPPAHDTTPADLARHFNVAP